MNTDTTTLPEGYTYNIYRTGKTGSNGLIVLKYSSKYSVTVTGSNLSTPTLNLTVTNAAGDYKLTVIRNSTTPTNGPSSTAAVINATGTVRFRYAVGGGFGSAGGDE